MTSNLQQINALNASTVKSADTERMLTARVFSARREIAALRRFAFFKAGPVADVCNTLATEIEQALAEALK